MPKLIILRGIPLSGKSTYAKKIERFDTALLSRDTLRMNLFSLKRYNDYKFSKENEKIVTDKFNFVFDIYLENNINIVLDNTNLKESYYKEYVGKAKEAGWEVEIKDFPISLTKAMLRNIVRRIKTGKWIPWKVLKTMQKNYKKITNE